MSRRYGREIYGEGTLNQVLVFDANGEALGYATLLFDGTNLGVGGAGSYRVNAITTGLVGTARYGIVNTNGSVSVGIWNNGSLTGLGSITAHDLALFTGDGSTKLYLKHSNGFIGVGPGFILPTSTFHINGSQANAIQLKTSAYTLTANDTTVYCTGTHTQTLPSAVGIAGRVYEIKNSNLTSGIITVDTTSGQTIDGTTSIILSPKQSLIARSDGTNWIRLNVTGELTGVVSFSGEIVPPTITTNQTDYNPTGLSTCNVMLLSSTGNVNINSLMKPSPLSNQQIYIKNINAPAGGSITIINGGAGTAGNIFDMGGSVNLQPGEGMQIIYIQSLATWASNGKNI